MDAPSAAQGQRFARDVRRIREAQDVTLKTIHQRTKIPEDLLSQFEEDALFTHQMFNRVYLRSVARSYADEVGIARTEMMEALEAALTGTYAGALAEQYLEEAPGESEESEAAAAAQAASAASATSGDAAKNPSAGAVEDHPEDSSGETEPADEPTPTTSTPAASTAKASGDPVVRANSKNRPVTERPGTPTWLYMLGGLAIIAAIIVLIFALQSNESPAPEPPPEESPETEVVPMDTAAEATAPVVPESEPEEASSPALGDTMRVVVIAAFDRLDPVRVRVDDDLRRPYWIEQGEERTFAATERITVENQLESVELTLNGVPFPTEERDEQNRIVITRERAEQVLAEAGGNS